MSTLGPRVGGAHVDVNLKFDDSSLNTLAKRIHTQLADIGRQNRKVYQGIGTSAVTAWRAALGSILAGAPLIGSAMSAATGAVTMLAGAVYSLGQSSYAALPFLTSFGLAGITAGIGMRGFMAAVSETNPKGLQELLEGMPKSMQDAVMSTRALSGELRAVVWPRLFAGVAEGIDSLRNTGVVKDGLGAMADSMNGLVRSLLSYAGTEGGISTIDKFLQNNAKVFEALSQAAVPFLDAFLRLINALVPSSLRLAGSITRIGEKFQGWTKSEGYGKRIDNMMKKASKTAGLLLDVAGNLGSALANVFGAANPATNNFLDMLIRVTERFKEFTASASGKSKIAEWAQNSVVVMKKFGETIRAVFDVISALADSRVILSFLTTLEGAFILLLGLPLEKMVTTFVQITEALQPISSAFLAVIVSVVAFNIMIGSLMGQIGGLFSVLGGFKVFGDVFKGIGGSAGKHAASVGKFTEIFKVLGAVLGKALRFAGLAGLAVYIALLISKSEKLQGKVMEAFQAFKDLAGPLKDAFNEIKTSLTPVAKGLSPVFGMLDKIASIGIGLILDSITYAFKSLGNVIKGAGKIIAGTIDFFVGLFTLDGSKMLDGLKKIGSGIIPLLKGLFGLFVTFFAPARLVKIGAVAFKGLFTGLKGATPGILSGLGRLITKMLSGFVKLAPRLLTLGGQALKSLGKAFVRGAGWVLKKAASIYIGILKFYLKLPGRLFRLGGAAFRMLGSAIQKALPVLLSIAGKIIRGIGTVIGKLAGLLFRLGTWALKRFAKSFMNGVRTIGRAAKDIFKAIWSEVKNLPGDMLNLGKAMIGGLVDGLLGKLDDLKGAGGKIGGAIKDFLPGSPVKQGPLTAWNHGGGATGGGRNVIDAITGGLRDTDPIRKAMSGVADAVSSSIAPSSRAQQAGVPSGTRTTERASQSPSGGGNTYIAKMMPHNYGEFERQMREKSRRAALGGRRPVTS